MSQTETADLMLEIRRQIVHSAGIGSIPAVLTVGVPLVLLGFVAQIAFFLSIGLYLRYYHTWWIERIVYTFERRNVFLFKGAITWAIGAGATLFLFPHNAAFAALAVLAIADAASTIIGKRWGTHKLRLNEKKSLEGSLAFIAFGTVVLQFFVNPIMALAVAIIVSQVEMLPKVDDNITIPLSVAFLVSVFGSVV